MMLEHPDLPAEQEIHIKNEKPILKTLNLLNDKWRILVIYQLGKKENQTYGMLRGAIPTMTNTMMQNTLRDLCSLEIIECSGSKPDCRFSLTQKGKDLFPAYYELLKWGEKYIDA